MTAERRDGSAASPQSRAPGSRPVRPRDAASIMVLDRSDARVRVLMGKRHSAHAFMPDLYVFPGGRRDPSDHRLAFAGDLHPVVLQSLKSVEGRPLTDARARALALAALRELYEEAGVRVGKPSLEPGAGLPFLPDLANLRYMARAITPPGHSRRFDTRFFAVFADEADVDASMILESRELQDLQWIDVNNLPPLQIPEITATILADLRSSLESDPSLPRERSVPFYFMRRGRFVRMLL
ncbi:NUDIX domain-containing protein [Sinorhizobium mexicanum]|uniref:NUDIX domain-containing protein n=1 Tax=Sinorhizobium mexicanum TaxID=375549 RepID=A0A859QHL4_9HYPH|nr:NUDIX domain-containing protein [Sinorhizobium mexicanum]MBP1882628.1 8-oxo-dGTP pyrophosphatase MutT (NUDIX family) [Sinorhizobium mexicanum]QLL61210.1 NUDIX domain-containing protein [Sinorhizobium mexicanum]